MFIVKNATFDDTKKLGEIKLVGKSTSLRKIKEYAWVEFSRSGAQKIYFCYTLGIINPKLNTIFSVRHDSVGKTTIYEKNVSDYPFFYKEQNIIKSFLDESFDSELAEFRYSQLKFSDNSDSYIVVEEGNDLAK